MVEDITEDRLLCTMLEVTYDKKFKELVKENNRELYPVEWFGNTNYRFKINVISEALKKNCLIKDTELFKESLRDVR